MKEPKAPVSKFDIYKSASAGYSDPADAFLSFYFIFYETLSRPSSSSHTLIGGFAGAAIMASGFGAIQLNIILKIAAFIFLAPFIGMVVAFGFTILVLHICRRVQPHKAEVWFKKLQLVSSAMFSIGHGLNDSQKVMGIIAAAMIAAHSMGLGMGINSIADLPDWVAFACFTAISLGTMSGGWKIVKTMGTKITKVTPLEGVVAETAGAFTLYLTEILKIPDPLCSDQLP